MKRSVYLFLLSACAISILSCFSTGNQQINNDPKDIRAAISRSCYEVVVKKPVKDSLVYEKELPWDLIDYNIRNDKFHPLGTAFAISETELVTAAHVLYLKDDSTNYSDFYIRDAAGNVYQIDQILSFHNSKDFIKFTVKNKKFSSWFNIRESYDVNESIFAVGNIYGQGIVAVPGTLLGTLPERENGQWLYLKSSPPNDKGSSGGPLLDTSGNVIGIIVAKDDNFSYSLPIAEMVRMNKYTGIFHKQFRFGFVLFPERTGAISFDQEVKLPAYYKEVKKLINQELNAHYKKSMAKLFADNRAEIFPNGSSSLMALNNACNETDLQVLFKDNDDRKWYFSNLKKDVSSLGNNGKIQWANINATYYIDLVKPDDITFNELYKNPKNLMDLILQGINMPRNFAGQDIRVLSFGEPFYAEKFVDSYGRKWLAHQWLIEYSDEVGVLVSTPTPNGMVCLLRFVRSSQRDVWLYDLKKEANFVYIRVIFKSCV